MIVSAAHGVPTSSMVPPHTSATSSPSRTTAAEAPTSSPASKLAASAARTVSNRGSQVPWTSAMALPLFAGDRTPSGASGPMDPAAVRRGMGRHPRGRGRAVARCPGVPFVTGRGGTMGGPHRGRAGDRQHEPDEVEFPGGSGPAAPADLPDMSERVAAVVRAYQALREARRLPDPPPTITPPAATGLPPPPAGPPLPRRVRGAGAQRPLPRAGNAAPSHGGAPGTETPRANGTGLPPAVAPPAKGDGFTPGASAPGAND